MYSVCIGCIADEIQIVANVISVLVDVSIPKVISV